MTHPTLDLQEDLERKLMDLDKPGAIFGEPIHEGEFTLIPVSKVVTNGRRTVFQPVAVVIIDDGKAIVHHFKNTAQVMGAWATIVTMVIWGVVVLLHPPWRPRGSLLNDVQQLLDSLLRHE